MPRESDIVELKTRCSGSRSTAPRQQAKRRKADFPEPQAALPSAVAVAPCWSKASPISSKVMNATVRLVRTVGEDAALSILVNLCEGWQAKPENRPLVSQAGDSAEAEGWLELRSRFMSQHGTASAPELARFTGSQASNPSARAYDWAKAGRVFSVNNGTEARFPLFQLLEGKPISVVADVLRVLRPKLSDWQIAFWFTNSNAWTGSWRAPAQLLASEPGKVLDAARHEAAEQML